MQIMDIKKEIEHFRSQALMSRYESAIRLGNKLIDKLILFEKVFNQDFTVIRNQVQQQLDYCIQLGTFMQGGQKKQNLQSMPKKNQEVQLQNFSKISESKKWKHESNNQLKHESHIENMNKNQQPETEEDQTIEDKIHKNMILPLNMPVFKLKSSIFLIRTMKCLDQVLEYLVNYDFKKFPSVDLSDLGVQNIVHCKQQMQSIGEKRVVIALRKESNQKNEFSKKQIEKLKNIVQVYRETYEKEKVFKKAVLALVVEQETIVNMQEKSSFLRGNQYKNVYFE